MAYKNEIHKSVSSKINSDFLSYKISIMPHVAVIEGVRSLLLYDSNLIKVKLKNCIASISGKNFCIAECCENQIIIYGTIVSVQVE